MQQIIQTSWTSEESSAEAQWRKVAHLHKLQQIIRSSFRFKETRAHSQWREAPQMFQNLESRCNKSFNRAESLSSHFLTHTGEKPHKCTRCPKSFSQASNLTAHVMTHTGEKPHSCAECNKSFSVKGSRDWKKKHKFSRNYIKSWLDRGKKNIFFPGQAAGRVCPESRGW